MSCVCRTLCAVSELAAYAPISVSDHSPSSETAFTERAHHRALFRSLVNTFPPSWTSDPSSHQAIHHSRTMGGPRTRICCECSSRQPHVRIDSDLYTFQIGWVRFIC